MKKLVAVLLIISFSILSPKAKTESFSATEVVDQFTNFECIDYCFVGLCWVMRCTPFGCSFSAKPQVKHNRPDYIVTTHNYPGGTPWKEMRNLVEGMAESSANTIVGSLSGGMQSGGGQDQESGGRGIKSYKFKEANIFGSPTAAINNIRGFCDSDATPFMPYFLSEVDAWGWRWGLVDRINPKSLLIGGKYDVGVRNKHTWGGKFPRIGHLSSKSDPKAAAVMATRAIAVQQDGFGGHLYIPFPEDKNEAKKPWLSITPKKGDTCEVLGEDNSVEWEREHYSKEGENAWHYWQRYECCLKDDDEILIAVTYFAEPICLNDQE